MKKDYTNIERSSVINTRMTAIVLKHMDNSLNESPIEQGCCTF